MPPRTHVVNDAPLPRGTLAELFLGAVDRFGEAAAFRRFDAPGVLRDISYLEALDQVRSLGAALEANGVTRGDRAAILSENRPEWAICDYACLCSGVVDVPIYSTLTAPQIAYILKDSGSKLVFVSNEEQMLKALEAREECAHEVQVVAFDPPASQGHFAAPRLIPRPPPADAFWRLRPRCAAIMVRMLDIGCGDGLGWMAGYLGGGLPQRVAPSTLAEPPYDRGSC